MSYIILIDPEHSSNFLRNGNQIMDVSDTTLTSSPKAPEPMSALQIMKSQVPEICTSKTPVLSTIATSVTTTPAMEPTTSVLTNMEITNDFATSQIVLNITSAKTELKATATRHSTRTKRKKSKGTSIVKKSTSTSKKLEEDESLGGAAAATMEPAVTARRRAAASVKSSRSQQRRTCDVCNKQFVGKSYFTHMKEHFPGPQHKCDTCELLLQYEVFSLNTH